MMVVNSLLASLYVLRIYDAYVDVFKRWFPLLYINFFSTLFIHRIIFIFIYIQVILLIIVT
jgi:hypothetical protein